MELDKISTLKPIIIVPICSHSFDKLLDIIKEIETVFEKFNPEANILNVATDGDKNRRKLFNTYRRINFDNTEAFDKMPLFDQYFLFGKWGVNYDWKHLTKRIRGILISKTRSITLIKHSINKATIETFLPQLKSHLNPSDYQNVPAAVKLLKGLDQINISDITINDFSPEIKNEIKLLSIIVEHFLAIFTQPKINLEDQLLSITTCSFLLFFIFRKQKTKFFTKDLYMDIQSSFQDIINSAIVFQKKFPVNPLYAFRFGTDEVEILFGICRTITHGSNFDFYEFMQRLKTVCQIQTIENRNPTWKKNKRLDIGYTEDYSSVDQWTGCLETKNLSIPMLWEIGLEKAKQTLQNFGFSNNDLKIPDGGKNFH